MLKHKLQKYGNNLNDYVQVTAERHGSVVIIPGHASLSKPRSINGNQSDLLCARTDILVTMMK